MAPLADPLDVPSGVRPPHHIAKAGAERGPGRCRGPETSPVAVDLTDKVVLITGGNGGIGAATARTLLDRGARVAVVDIDPTTPKQAGELHPTSAFGCIADLGGRPSLEAVVAQTVDRFCRLGGVIAGAGRSRRRPPFATRRPRTSGHPGRQT